ncbi:Heterokaryon incompatibility protein 6, OR allele [Colletotrichum siamense]|uniref:Heterokaryon incompatibility protein 6, OR allele n=1 Tax=Colletotrichum siamense TaxID=690259 RepID=A0A9P5EP00_COLSI|nr:Heterokaryon incompatibility protein 6, OR allele [Colletotrichum siamense]KAF4855828.1 Heterokaryon incompatibility protein 6, OR allele [Colletotrichum siamense]
MADRPETSSSAVSRSLEQPLRADFDLCWPSSLSFVDDASREDGLTGVASTTRLKVPDNTDKNFASIIGEDSNTGDDYGFGKPKTPLYEPLYGRKIRLLKLLPGKYHDPLRCKLQTVDLQFKPEYEALSYTWADPNGDSSLSQKIYVGMRHDILFITANCANALRRLRFPSWSRDLWVDAICIDQHNTHERSHQVGIMRYIYATAERVIIYLGEDAEDAKLEASVPWKYENHGNTLDLSTDLRKQPYFTRVWVIQEVASARSAWILLGSKGARWEDFLKPPNTGDEDYRVTCISNYDLLTAHHPWLLLFAQPKHRDLRELWDLLSATALCQASDPRDKVFALLGLFIGSSDAGLVPDYSLSLSQVLTGLTAFMFGQHPDFWPTMFAMANSRSLNDMPNWAIDWLNPTGETGLALLKSLPSVSGSHENISLDPANDNAARFCIDGALVLKGVPLFSLIDCVVEPVEASLPGYLAGIRHSPASSDSVRETLLGKSKWARRGDKVYAMAGLQNEFLILRPLECERKQSFVGICKNTFYTEPAGELVVLLERRRALLFSAWNEILDHSSADWLTEQAWNYAKSVCGLIKEYWQAWVERLEGGGSDGSSPRLRSEPRDDGSAAHVLDPTASKNPLLGLRDALEEERCRRDQLYNGCTKPHLGDSYFVHAKSNVPGRRDQLEVNLANFLSPVCRQYTLDRDLTDADMVPENRGDPESVSHWPPSGYMNHQVMDGFWRQLGHVLRSEISYHASGYESAANYLQRLSGQKLTHKSRDFDALVRYYEAGNRLSPRPKEEEKRDDDAFLLWIRNSMELDPCGHWFPEWHFSDNVPETWVDIFCETWDWLTLRPGLVSHEPLSPMLFKRNTDEGGMRTKSFEGKPGAGGLTVGREFEDRAWGALKQLVDKTEALLLPLEEAFTKPGGVATCANKTEEMKWEDVYIV